MVKFLDLQKVTASFGPQLGEAVNRVIASGRYLLGPETEAFEHEYAAYIGTNHCVACANGLDALTLILRGYIALGVLAPGDEVAVPSNTFIASVLAITDNGLVPRFVEPDPNTSVISAAGIEQALTPRTRAVMLVHLYGRCAYSNDIGQLCHSRNLILVEDNAQAHGCLFEGRRTGSLGHAAGHSFYPGKNLGALGDAGAVTTSDPMLADVVRALANYGSAAKYVFDFCGRNSRMDEMQAAVLRVKLRRLDADNARRVVIADRYNASIRVSGVATPAYASPGSHVYHIYPLMCDRRDDVQAMLAAKGVETLIHYPIPPHRQKCYTTFASLHLPVADALSAAELSLPMSPVLTDAEVDTVIEAVNSLSL